MTGIRIETSITGDLITQEVTGPERDWRTMARERISFEVMNTKDAQVREALIQMGWTPPRNGPEVKPVRMCIIQQSEHEHSTTSYATIRDFQQARKGLILETKAVDPA